MAQLRTLVRRRLALTTIGSFVTTVVLIATLSFALILAGRGSITIGDAAVAIVGLQQLSSRLQSAGAAFNGVHEGVTFLRDFEDFRATLPVIREQRPTGVAAHTSRRRSRSTGVGYRYPGASDDAVRDVSFELRRGQIMAVVGANGSGKTTLAKLLCDLLPPTQGIDRAGTASTSPGATRRSCERRSPRCSRTTPATCSRFVRRSGSATLVGSTTRPASGSAAGKPGSTI